MPRTLLALFVLITLSASPMVWLSAQEADPHAKQIKAASDEGQKAIARMRLPQGLQAKLVAAEPLLANPVAFCIDEKGRFYVAETFRLHDGVPDNRGHMYWLDDELACRTVADRIAMYKKHKHYDKWGKAHDRVRLCVWDSDGDGVCDKASVFAHGFNNPEDGLGSGVLARGNKVWYTCIPHLWLLEDTKGANKADVKKSLHQGYGVHVAFIGHDLHGLAMGPDGKLYFSVGDRGAHVEKDGKVLASTPDTGAVFRCDPDGSNLEIFHTGLRNPQELAFDQYGNLFTGDNNADGGDKARWVHLVEGGDSGWRIGYQYLKNLGPWNAEKLWHTRHPGQAAAHLPPLAHMGNGPSGLTYNPGVTLLSEEWKDCFFLVDFRGGSGGSGIHGIKLRLKGASFEVDSRRDFVWSTLATDCDFGPDGGFYFSDWVEGWGLTGKGRIYRVSDPVREKDAAILAVKKMLAEGFDQRATAELAKLLDHADMRVRREAQFVLAQRQETKVLVERLQRGFGNLEMGRLHAVWGLGQIARAEPEALKNLLAHLPGNKPKEALGPKPPAPPRPDDPPKPPVPDHEHEEVLAQTLKVIAERRYEPALAPLLAAFSRSSSPPILNSARVRFYAALALGSIGQQRGEETAARLLSLLAGNPQRDPYLRHAAVEGLARLGDRKLLANLAARSLKEQAAPDSRQGLLLAMRRLEMPEVAFFLNDPEPTLALEAARAINDQPINAAMPQLAALVNKPLSSSQPVPPSIQEPLSLRALNANYRLGQKQNTEAIAAFAARSSAPADLRVEALRMLHDWEKPSGRDRVVGLWRPLKERPAADAGDALRLHLAGIMTGPDKVRSEGVKTAARHGINEVGPALRNIVADAKNPAAIRVESLKALEALKDAQLVETARANLEDGEARVRVAARRVVFRRAPTAESIRQLIQVLEKGTVIDKQGTLALFADLQNPATDGELARWLQQLAQDQVPAEIRLDILEAARRRNTADLRKLLAAYDAKVPKDNPTASYREALAGGDADSGRRIFFEKSELSCLRCHKVNGSGGEVGPELAGIGAKQKREYLLESLVDPNKQIAKGFETVVLNLLNGQVKSGILKSEDKKEVRLINAEGQVLTVPVAQIEERGRGPSAMPADLVQKLSRAELRDLVEFLAGLK